MKEPSKNELAEAIVKKCNDCPASHQPEDCNEEWCNLYKVKDWAKYKAKQNAVQES